MNKKGQGTGIAIIVAITLFIVGMVTVNILTIDVSLARNSENLDCANVTGISDGTKLTCLAVDWAVPYLFILVFSAAGGFITRRFLI